MKKAMCGIMLLLLLTVRVAAAEQGNITVCLRSSRETVSGAQIVVYPVGKVGEDGTLVLHDPFPEGSISRAVWTEPETAQMLWEYSCDHALSGESCRTDEMGKAVFPDLQEGVYLLGQVAAAEGYQAFSPFLVVLPAKTGGKINWNVQAFPKITPEESPKTWDPAALFPALLLGAGSLCLSARLWQRRKNDRPHFRAEVGARLFRGNGCICAALCAIIPQTK